jgi:hypothetical protein
LAGWIFTGIIQNLSFISTFLISLLAAMLLPCFAVGNYRIVPQNRALRKTSRRYFLTLQIPHGKKGRESDIQCRCSVGPGQRRSWGRAVPRAFWSAGSPSGTGRSSMLPFWERSCLWSERVALSHSQSHHFFCWSQRRPHETPPRSD